MYRKSVEEEEAIEAEMKEGEDEDEFWSCLSLNIYRLFFKWEKDIIIEVLQISVSKLFEKIKEKAKIEGETD